MEIEIQQKTHPMKLTLGALAEIESALELRDITALMERLKKPSANDLLVIVAALLRGGGNNFSKEDLSVIDVNLSDLTERIAACFVTQTTENVTPGK